MQQQSKQPTQKWEKNGQLVRVAFGKKYYLWNRNFSVTAVLIIQDLFRHSDVELRLLTASGHHTWLFIFVIRHIFKCHKTFIIRLSVVSIIFLLYITLLQQSLQPAYFGNYKDYLATIFQFVVSFVYLSSCSASAWKFTSLKSQTSIIFLALLRNIWQYLLILYSLWFDVILKSSGLPFPA